MGNYEGNSVGRSQGNIDLFRMDFNMNNKCTQGIMVNTPCTINLQASCMNTPCTINLPITSHAYSNVHQQEPLTSPYDGHHLTSIIDEPNNPSVDETAQRMIRADEDSSSKTHSGVIS